MQLKVTQKRVKSLFLSGKYRLKPYTSASLKLRKGKRENLVTFLNSTVLKIVDKIPDFYYFIYVLSNKICVT